MSTRLDMHSAVARITPADVSLELKSVKVTLDESWSPYCQVQLVAVLPDAADRDLLDLRSSALRLDLRIRQDFGTTWTLGDVTADFGGSISALTAAFGGLLRAFNTRYSRPFNSFGRRNSTSRLLSLRVTERYFDHVKGELRITAASGETRLQTDALIDTEPLDPGTTSVRDIAQLILDRYNYQLQPGDDDGTVESDATMWKPGTTAWDYFAPLAQSVNLKLWCDELARWYLTVPEPASDGSLTLVPSQTIKTLTDGMTAAGDEWFDAVVIRYSWTDSLGVNQTAYDVAGPVAPKNVLTIEHDTPYPGPGAAAGILSRGSGRGRVLDVVAISDYSAQPGQAASITPPDTDEQTGYVAAVSWSWPEAEMKLTSRGLVDTPPEAWIALEEGESWDDSPIGESWVDELIGA